MPHWWRHPIDHLAQRHNVANIFTWSRLGGVIIISAIMLYFIIFYVPPRNLGFLNVPFGVHQSLFIFVIIVYCLSMLTDFFDGYFARKYHQETTFGKVFDPIFDKLLTTITILLLTVYGLIIPIWAVVIIIARDLFVNGLKTQLATLTIDVRAKWHGKWKTLAIFITTIVSMLLYGFLINVNEDIFHLINNLIWIIPCGLTLTSGLLYFINDYHRLSR